MPTNEPELDLYSSLIGLYVRNWQNADSVAWLDIANHEGGAVQVFYGKPVDMLKYMTELKNRLESAAQTLAAYLASHAAVLSNREH